MRIWVNGCFDIIHGGHIDLLWYAKLFGLQTNQLIVGLDNDERVRELKGETRPVNNIAIRKKIIENLKMVDEVCVFGSDKELIDMIKAKNIDYIIVGDQYKDKTVIGSEHAKFGVEFYPVDKQSTTGIIEKIKGNVQKP